MQFTDQINRIPIPSSRFGNRKKPDLLKEWQLAEGDEAVDGHRIAAMIQHIATAPSSSVASWRVRFLVFSWSLRNRLLQGSKRVFDLLVVLLLLPVALPFMILTAIAIKLDSPGPILFRQERVGKWGQIFNCLKFRSMYVDAEARKQELMHLNEADGVVFKIKQDPRVTRVGRLIRKLSVDELPQLFNVLQGNMSLVGPRPPVPIEVVQYEFDHFRRLDAIPGITGLQQVKGRSDISFERWVALDVQYIEEQSLRKDLWILLMTIPAVISGRGAY
ncbi:MAG: sugar transferase [Anaerolineales bacterium]|jgi:lipopolysaccharide/colanic/teichoic acid biosynthesis glycosyltransferase